MYVPGRELSEHIYGLRIEEDLLAGEIVREVGKRSRSRRIVFN